MCPGFILFERCLILGCVLLPVVILRTSAGAPAAAAAELVQEANILNSVPAHINVIGIVGVVGASTSDPWVLIPYCSHGSLLKYIRQRHQTEEFRVQSLRGVARGMVHLGVHGVVHRDLAARNVLLGDSLCPRIADFGLSRDGTRGKEAAVGASDEGISNECIYYRSSIGSDSKLPLKWTAIEAIVTEKFTIASDVWSFGILMVPRGCTPWPARELHVGSGGS